MIGSVILPMQSLMTEVKLDERIPVGMGETINVNGPVSSGSTIAHVILSTCLLLDLCQFYADS